MGSGRKRRTWYKKKLRRQRWQAAKPWLFGGAVGVIALGLILGVQRNEDPAPAVAPSNPAAAAFESARAEALAPKPSAVILGDSFTAASGGYADRLARLMKWDATVLGQGGTGYTNPGQAAEGDSAYPDRIPEVIELQPEIVVVQGSTNDGDGYGLQEAADSVFSQLKEGLPDARIIAVGPVAAPSIPEEKIDIARTTLADVTSKYSVPFIDPAAEGWLSDPELFTDGVHPSPGGHQEMAANIAEAIPATAP